MSHRTEAIEVGVGRAEVGLCRRAGDGAYGGVGPVQLLEALLRGERRLARRKR